MVKLYEAEWYKVVHMEAMWAQTGPCSCVVSARGSRSGTEGSLAHTPDLGGQSFVIASLMFKEPILKLVYV